MRRIILILCLFAGPALAQEYNIPFNPQAVASAGQLFTETCATLPGSWTDQSDNSGAWATDSGTCEAVTTADNDFVSMVQTATDGDDVFCSMKVTQMSADGAGIGCSFRGAATADAPGAHYWVGFSNNADKYRLWSHSAASPENHSSVNLVSGTDDCGCSAYSDLDPSGGVIYIGVTVTGTGQDGTAASWWSFGLTPPSDLNDPSTWGTATCACDTSEVGAVLFTEVDTTGACGPSGFATGTNDTAWPNIDNFACGDIP